MDLSQAEECSVLESSPVRQVPYGNGTMNATLSFPSSTNEHALLHGPELHVSFYTWNGLPSISPLSVVDFQ
jgi:hypothetical protein